MMLRALLFTSLVAAAPSVARADCIAGCGDVCYAPAQTGFYRGEVTAAADGYPTRVRLVELLTGDPVATIGEERDDVYVETSIGVGGSLFVAMAAFTDGTPGYYVWNVAREIDGDEIVCAGGGQRVALDAYAAMAASDDCPAIREQLDLTPPPCDDTYEGCSAGAGSSLGLGALALGALALRRRRR